MVRDIDHVITQHSSNVGNNAHVITAHRGNIWDRLLATWLHHPKLRIERNIDRLITPHRGNP